MTMVVIMMVTMICNYGDNDGDNDAPSSVLWHRYGSKSVFHKSKIVCLWLEWHHKNKKANDSPTFQIPVKVANNWVMMTLTLTLIQILYTMMVTMVEKMMVTIIWLSQTMMVTMMVNHYSINKTSLMIISKVRSMRSHNLL